MLEENILDGSSLEENSLEKKSLDGSSSRHLGSAKDKRLISFEIVSDWESSED